MQTDEQNRRPSALVRHRLSLIAAAAILAYAAFVHYVWGWGSIVAEWRTIGYGTVAAVIGLLVSTYFVRAWRLYDYFPGETTGRLVELFHLAQVHNLLNIMLPFRSGETSFPLLMRSEFSVPLLHGTSALLVMRLLDLHALLAAGGLGLVLASEAKLLPVVVWLAFLVAPIPAFLLKGPVLAALRPRLRGKLARILDGSGDVSQVTRRMVVMASEDIGNADPQALQLALNAALAYDRLGSPEGEIPLAQAVTYLALAPKSNAAYAAWDQAKAFVKRSGSQAVPLHLRNAPTKLMKQMGYREGYRYAHDEPNGYAAGQTYFPEGVARPGWYQPTDRGVERRLGERLTWLRSLDDATPLSPYT